MTQYLTVYEPSDSRDVHIAVHTWPEIKAMLTKAEGNLKIYRIRYHADPERLFRAGSNANAICWLEDRYGNIIEQ